MFSLRKNTRILYICDVILTAILIRKNIIQSSL